MTRRLALLALLLVLPAAATAAPPPAPLTPYHGEVDVRVDTALDAPRCEALSKATLQQRNLDADSAAFTLAVTGPCGEMALAFRGERVGATDDWTFREAAGDMTLLRGHLRQLEPGEPFFDFRLALGPCATGDILCEHPLVGGATVRGTLEMWFTVGGVGSAPGPWVVRHEGAIDMDVRPTLGVPDACAWQGPATLVASYGWERAEFVLLGTTECGPLALAFQGVLAHDGWSIASPSPSAPVVSGSFTRDPADPAAGWTLDLRVHRCPPGLICEFPTLATVHGTFDAGTVLF